VGAFFCSLLYRGKLYETRKQSHGGQIPGTRIDKNCPSSTTAEQIGKEYGVAERTVKNDAEFSKSVDKVAAEVGKEYGGYHLKTTKHNATNDLAKVQLATWQLILSSECKYPIVKTVR